MSSEPITLNSQPRKGLVMCKILLVDDDEDFLLLLGEYMSLRDQQFDKAGSCDEARSLLRNNRYDIVISDFNMPLESGLDLFYHVSKTHPGIPFILMTGCEDDLVQQKAIRMGVSAYIKKPFHLSELMDTIGDLVQLASPTPEQIVQNFLDRYGNLPVLENQW